MEIYRDDHWIVSPDGIKGTAKEFFYWIAMDRIFEKTERVGVEYYNWPVSIAEKEVVEVAPFLRAFVAAVEFEARQGIEKLDQKILERSLQYATIYSPHQFLSLSLIFSRSAQNKRR